jgi:murein L,D-transpeptidase YcbB/YkuD
MKPAGNANTPPASSCKPSTKIKSDSGPRRFLQYTIRLSAMAGLLMLSTSYQSHKNELILMEKEFYVPAFADHMKNILQMHPGEYSIDTKNFRIKTAPFVEEFYASRNYKPAWTTRTTENKQAQILLDLLDNAERFGLKSSLFRVEEIRSELDRMKNQEPNKNYLGSRINAELLLSDACLQFMIYLNKGYREFDSSLYAEPVVSEFPDNLMNAISGHDFEKHILSVQPDVVEYRNLQKALEMFLAVTQRSDTRIPIPDPAKDSVLFRNTAENVLISLGYLQTGSKDIDFISALKKFQHYHGLEPDGIPGRNTCQALAQTTEDKFRQIALNLDRIRKENIQTKQFIEVNIPAFRLRIFKGNQIMGSTKVIVGSLKTPTPLINGKLERIITNPFWQVPRSITLGEILPKLKSDSDYLSRNRLRLMDESRNPVSYRQVDWTSVSAEKFDYRIRQDGGADNALGRVKFVFPNPYSVYLHDTPGKQSFALENRALSHGCIRVQDPGLLADYLVREFSPHYRGQDLSDMMEKGIRREISLDNPVDIYIRYLTCETDESFNIFFYNDIYGWDTKELQQLEFLQ